MNEYILCSYDLCTFNPHLYYAICSLCIYIYSKIKKKNIDWKKIHDVPLGSVKMGEYRKGGRWDL